MRQLLQHLRNGQTVLVDVPAPGVRAGEALIQTSCTLVSAGTERMLIEFGRAGWLGKARQQPEKLRAAVTKVRVDGLVETLRAIRAKLDQPLALGYCHVGRVIEANEADWTRVGTRMVSTGPHAEIVSGARWLCARIPDVVSDEEASFTPLAAIALQGINLLAPACGDKVVVTGLGLIGQLAVQILRARGCEVLGLDPDPNRQARARNFGATVLEGDPVACALNWTAGKGVSGVLITASTASNEVVNEAARSCRYRGKIVLIGVVGLRLNRADFYRNEVSFQVSKSYGRREPDLSDSARANFEQVLALMAEGKLLVADLITHRFAFEEAPRAYAALRERNALGIVMNYGRSARVASGRISPFPSETGLLTRTVHLPGFSGTGVQRIALIGAGNFANRTLLPALKAMPAPPTLAAVASAQGVSAVLTATKFGAAKATTDVGVVLTDPSIAAVLITTRHDMHVPAALAALNAGKHVWVEKPLGIAMTELDKIEEWIKAHASPSNGRMLMVGFNRRFAPIAATLKRALRKHGGPANFTITVNAGRLDREHWTLDPAVGGGRIVGEACHFVDLLRFLADSPIERVLCQRRDLDGQDGGCFQIWFRTGSIGVINYRTDLPPRVPKEITVVEGSGYRAEIRNWSRLVTRGLGGVNIGFPWSRSPRKGHFEALTAFLSSIQSGAAPIPVVEIFEVSRWAIAMQRMHKGDFIERSQLRDLG